MPRMRLIIVLAVVVGAFMALAPSANASWTHLGGDPLFPGGIKGSGQTARNDFVRKMNTGRAAKAMRLAGLNATERKAVRNAVNKGQFKECKLNYGDHFQKMSFGAGTIFVDRNVTFADPSYKGTGAPAFCLTVTVKYKNGKVTTIKIKVPFKCVNISVISKKTTKKGKKGCGCKTPPPPKVVCANTGVMVDSIQQCVTQTQQTTQDCQAGTIKQGNQCVVIQNQCGNVNVGGDNNTQGGNCNVTNVCSNVNSPGGTVNCNSTPTCEQSGTCPPGDQGPQISCVYPAHVFTGGNVQIWCEASDPEGDPLTVNVISDNVAGHISGVIPVSIRWDASACPANVKCYRATFWGDTVGTAHVTATVTANGKSSTSVGTFPVLDGNTGF